MRRFAGSFLGAALALLGWKVLGVDDFASRLLVAVLAFGLGHLLARLVFGAPTAPPAASPILFWIVAFAAGAVILFVSVVKVMELYDRRRAAATPPSSTPPTAAPRPVKLRCDRGNCQFEGALNAQLMHDMVTLAPHPSVAITWNGATPDELLTASFLDDYVHRLTIHCAGALPMAPLMDKPIEELWLSRCLLDDHNKLPSSLRSLHVDDAFDSLQWASRLDRLEGLYAEGAVDLRVLALLQKLKGEGAMAEANAPTPLDLTPLTSLTKLKNLDLSRRAVLDAKALASIPSLESVRLDDVPLVDLSPFKSLTGLKKLQIAGTAVSDLTPLAGLSSLRELDVARTKVSAADKAAFHAAHPDVTLWQ